MSKVGDENAEVPRDERVMGWGPFKVRAYVYYTVLIVMINIVLFADTNLLAPVLTPIAREFGFVVRDENGDPVMVFDDRLKKMVEQVDTSMRDKKLGGDITIAFYLIGGSVSLIVGYLADTVNRRNCLAAVVILGETSCLATYWTTDYWGLFVTRALTGVSIGGAIPLVYSLFGDLFSVAHRGKAIAAAGMAIGAGGGVGQTLAGPIAGTEGTNWRASFVAVAVPAYALCILLLLTVEEPPRGHKEEAYLDRVTGDSTLDYSEKLTFKKVRTLLSTPTVLLIFIQGIPGSLPWGAFGGFISDFLAEEKNIDIRLTGIVVIIFGVGITVGNVAAGIMCDKMFTNYKRWIPIVLLFITIAGAIPLAIYVDVPPMGFAWTTVYMVPSGFCLGFAGNSLKMLLVNVTTPETRGTAFSVLNLFDDLGRGLGVFYLSRFFDAFEDKPGKTARAQGIQWAFLLGWIICSCIIGIIFFFVDRDYERAQTAVANAIDERKRIEAEEGERRPEI